jgi:broad-specificity NMP kinase
VKVTIVAGAGGTGKTTYANILGGYISTDYFKFLEWSEQSAYLAGIIAGREEDKDIVIEGFSALRALRKFFTVTTTFCPGYPEDTEDTFHVIMMVKPYAPERYRESDAVAQVTILKDIVEKFPFVTFEYKE